MKITKTSQTGVAGIMAGVAPASGVTISDPGGYFGSGPFSLEDFVALIGSGAYGPFLRNTLGGLDVVEGLGTLGATVLIDLANANWFWGTLDQDCTMTAVGWTDLSGATIHVEWIQDGTGGWVLDIDGVTWVGDPPAASAAGTVGHAILFSRDGGVTIYGAVVGGGGAGAVTAAAISALGFVGPILMTDGITSPPEPLWTDDGTDYLYQDMG